MMTFSTLVKKDSLDFRNRGLRDGDLDVIIEVIQKSKVLKRLDLANNLITLSDNKLTGALEENSTLQELSLYNNEIGLRGAVNLAAVLKKNKTLQEIYLTNNQIGSEGCKSFASALVFNTTITILDLKKNNICDDGALCLAPTLMKHTSIREVNLRGNNIGSMGLDALINALNSNYMIDDFDASNNPKLSSKEVRGIARTLNGTVRNSSTWKLQIKSLSAKLGKKDDDLRSREKYFAQKDDEIDRLNKALESKDKEINLLKNGATIKNSEDKDNEVQQLHMELAEKRKEIDSLRRAGRAIRMQAEQLTKSAASMADLADGGSRKRPRHSPGTDEGGAHEISGDNAKPSPSVKWEEVETP